MKNKLKIIFWIFLISLAIFSAFFYIANQMESHPLALIIALGFMIIFAPNFIGVIILIPIVLAGLIIFAHFLYLLIIKRKIWFKFVIIAILVLNFIIADHIANRFFPDKYTRLNRESNKEKIDKNIPAADIQQIREVAKKVDQLPSPQNAILKTGFHKPPYPILEISYYDCSKQTDETEEKKFSFGAPKKSQKCQPGDVFLYTGKNHYCGGLCGEWFGHYYLLRKIQNEWQIIEDLGGYNWVS